MNTKPGEMSEEEKARKARSEIVPGKVRMTKDENVLYLIHNMDLTALPPIDIRTCQAEEIRLRGNEYFRLCMEDCMKPSMGGLCIALNCSRPTLVDYLNGVRGIPNDNREELERIHRVLNALMEDYMQNGKINPVAGIFLMKNDYGYKDQQEFVVNNNTEENVKPEVLLEEAKLLFDGEPKKANYE